MRGKHGVHEYIRAIEQAIDRIEQFTQDHDYDAFVVGEKTQDAVCYNFIVIGEAARDIQRNYPQVSQKLPQDLLSDAYRMRNWLAHGYLGIDLDIVWQTIITDLPSFKEQIESMIIDET